MLAIRGGRPARYPPHVSSIESRLVTHMDDWIQLEGAPTPLGLSWIEGQKAFNFALYSKHASAVSVLLYSAEDLVRPLLQFHFDPLVNKSGRVWHCRLKADAIKGARYYAYRVVGPNEPGVGHRFDHQKILLDPYVKAVYFPQHYSRQAACLPGSNAGRAPLGVIANDRQFPWDGDRHPTHTSDTVIYELHVRNFTRRDNSGVSPEKRGTFADVIEKIPFLKGLGVTVVELMPVPQRDPQEGSY